MTLQGVWGEEGRSAGTTTPPEVHLPQLPAGEPAACSCSMLPLGALNCGTWDGERVVIIPYHTVP